MRTILNMKPGPGGRRLQKELEAKTSGSVYWPAFTFDRSEDYEESVKEILEGAERGRAAYSCESDDGQLHEGHFSAAS